MSALPASLSSLSHSGGRLVSTDGRALSFSGGTLSVEAAGGIASITLRQRFSNPHAEPLRVTYTMPLPTDAAVAGFAFELGDQRIVGAVDTRQRARARFEEALIEGRTAALLEQDRSSLFTQEVGNIPPGQDVVCELVLDQRLRWQDGGWEWRFPTVVAPRYLGEPGRVPDASRVTVDVAAAGTPARMALALHIQDTLTGAVASPSHPIHVTDADGTTVGLQAEDGAALDRDIVVRWPVAAHTHGIHLEVGRERQETASGILTLVPPAQPLPAVPRDLVILLDTSGSMGGAPLRQAQAVTTALIQSLGAQDRLQLIEFSTRPRAWRDAPVAMTADAQSEATAWVRGLRAGGGTEMRAGILSALETLRDEAQRQVILVTDGLIGFEQEIIGAILNNLPRGCRVHSVGIGSSVNRSLLSGTARAGGGQEVIIGIGASPAQAAETLVHATAAPQVVDVTVSGDALVSVAQHRVPDLMACWPARIAVQLRPEGGTLSVVGHTAQGPWTQQLTVPPVPTDSGSLAAVKLVGRARAATLELHAAVGKDVNADLEAIGLAYQIATRMTSWLAVSQQATVDASAPSREERVPQALPYGMSAESVGLARPQKRRTIHRALMARIRPLSEEAAPVQDGDGLCSPVPMAPPRKARRKGRFSPRTERRKEERLSQKASKRKPTPETFRRTCQVQMMRNGTAMVRFIMDRDLEWTLPERVTVRWTDGTTQTVRVRIGGSTATTPVSAGSSLRLVLALAEAASSSRAIATVTFTLPSGLHIQLHA